MSSLKVQRSLRLSQKDWDNLILPEMKMQMMRQKFTVRGSLGEWLPWNTRDEVFEWLHNNTSDFWFVPEGGSADDLSFLFLSEKDAVNFKVAWDGADFADDPY